ncbi:MAG: tRNA guanosine(34) transglycosylase Tgt [Bacteroidales bacterium]|nr:tRNA guanosine(34) transglycosylase Tgt [Bacteroidales bacterium]
MHFDLLHTAPRTKARAGVLHTDHGDIPTPIFMPVGTVGSVKAVHQHELTDDIDASIILGNTYHLYLRPGVDILKEAGGLHRFMNWHRPILTDSGGFQVFSLADSRKLTADGCTFKSHIDGSRHTFTPEKVVDIQRAIGSDIMMAFDECPPGESPYNYAKKSMLLTHSWLDRCWQHFCDTKPLYGHQQALFPIVQGCKYPDLRRQSAEYVASKNAVGYAIGGLAVGEPTEVMYSMIEIVNAILPTDKPRYLMGVGTPANLLEAIERGVDMFDCVMPTRNGRNGMLFTWNGTVNIKNKKWENCFEPIDPDSTAAADLDYTFAYLHHLIRSEELLGLQIASIHNLAFYLSLVRTARQHIVAGDFAEWKAQVLPKLMVRI